MVITVTELTTIQNPKYLFEFIEEQSDDKVYCILENISTATERFDEFVLVDSVDLTLPYAGFYSYKVYQQESDSNLNPELSDGLVEEGRAHVYEDLEAEGVYDTIFTNYIYEQNEAIISVFSQVVDFSSTPMNSIVYLSDGNYVDASYGYNETNLTDLIAMFNSVPPVQAQATFLEFGVCYDNGDGRVRMEMPLSVYNTFPAGEITLNVIYD